jgi:hypothetical protein
MKKSWDAYLNEQMKKPKVRAAFEAAKKTLARSNDVIN